jgi:hypothetical protein
MIFKELYDGVTSYNVGGQIYFRKTYKDWMILSKSE